MMSCESLRIASFMPQTRARHALRFGLAFALMALGVAGCRSCEAERHAPPSACALLDPPADWLVLEAVDQAQGLVRILPIDLSGPEPAVRPAAAHPALPMPNWPGHYRALATHAGPALLLVAPVSTAADAELELRYLHLDRPDDPPVRAALGSFRPAALHWAGRALGLVSSSSALALVDFRSAPPVIKPVPVRDFGAAKRPAAASAYGLFVQRDDAVVAVHDEGTPFYADAFKLDCGGGLRRESALFLPGLVNGSYTEAALDGSDLLLVAHYTVAVGAGHLVSRLPLERLQSAEAANSLLNAEGQPQFATLTELEPEEPTEPDEPPTLLAGDRYTPWAGMAVVGDYLLLGAHDRGVLSLPRELSADSRVTSIDVQGRCLDLTSRGATAYALVRGATSTKVAALRYDRSRGRFALADTIAVAGDWDSFVR